MLFADTLKTLTDNLANKGQDLVDKQKTQWLDEADTRLRAIVTDTEQRMRQLADETTTKLHRTAMLTAGIIAVSLLALTVAILCK